MKRMNLVVIGNGMAGMRTIEELLKIAPDAYNITVFGDEPHPNYNRIMLSPVLAGEHGRQHDAVVVGVRLIAEHGDVVGIRRNLEQLLYGAHARHAIADDYQVHSLHFYSPRCCCSGVCP